MKAHVRRLADEKFQQGGALYYMSAIQKSNAVARYETEFKPTVRVVSNEAPAVGVVWRYSL